MSKVMLALVGEPEPLTPAIPTLQPTISSAVQPPTQSTHSTALTTLNTNVDYSKSSSFPERSITPTNKQAESVMELKTGYSPPVRDTTPKSRLFKENTVSPRTGSAISVNLNSMTVTGSSVGLGTGTSGIAKEWSVQPEVIVIPAPTTDSDPVVKRLQLNNYSDRQVAYDVSWPAHVVCVTPEQGTVEPRSVAILLVSPHVGIRTRGLKLPWSGNMHLTCDNQHQIVKVQIREGVSTEDSLMLSAGDTPVHPLTPVPATPSFVSVATPVHPSVKSLGHSKTPTQQLAFDPTTVDKKSESFMEVTNTSAFPIKWQLSSFTPPYFKVPSSLCYDCIPPLPTSVKSMTTESMLQCSTFKQTFVKER